MSSNHNIWVPKYTKPEEIVIVNQFDDDLKPIEIPLPDIPNDKDILNYGRATTEQIFRRTEYNTRLKALQKRVLQQCKVGSTRTRKLVFREEMYRELFSNQKQYKDIIAWINQEWDRRENGYWIFIGGVRTYFPGKFNLFLNYWQLPIPQVYATYRDSDRKKFVFREYAFNDSNCFGTIEITKRRDGKSEHAMCCLYDEISKNRGYVAGIQSKTDEDAEKLFAKLIRSWWGAMPFFFSPIHSHSKKPTTSIKFENNKATEGEDDLSLNSEADYRAAKEASYDGYMLNFYVDDEYSKLERYDCEMRWNIVKPSLMDPFGNIIGNSMHTSTIEDMGKHGFKQAKKLWQNSSYHDRDPKTGRTLSGLWRLFTPAYEGHIIDHYGRTNYEESKQVLLNIREQERTSNNKSSYYQMIRKFPFNLREAFIISSHNCPFDIDIIVKRMERFFNGNPFVRRGDFIWKNGEIDGEVVFKENATGGRFYVSHLPDEGVRNNQDRRGRILKPGNALEYIAGGDTFKFDDTESSDPSFGGGAVLRRYNPILDGNLNDTPHTGTWEEQERHTLQNFSRRFVCTYNYRPPSKKDYVEDMIKMCKFYGCGMFPEMNVPTLQDGFDSRGYSGYLVYRYDKKKMKVAVNAGDVSTNPIKDELFSVTNDYILESGEHEVHEDLMEQWLKVNFATMTDYDLFTAAAYALYGDKLTYVQVQRERERAEKIKNSKVSGKSQWFEKRVINLNRV